jgi:hypothetical protein
MDNRVNLDFSIGRIAYERIRDLARRANYKDLVSLFQHGILVMDLIISSYEEGYEFYRIKDDIQEKIMFVIGDQFDEEEAELLEEDQVDAPTAEVISLFPSKE